tara:strand:- start:348 stop:890 length:543 start_codon:yes stop_codon:yes gene_type:complete
MPGFLEWLKNPTSSFKRSADGFMDMIPINMDERKKRARWQGNMGAYSGDPTNPQIWGEDLQVEPRGPEDVVIGNHPVPRTDLRNDPLRRENIMIPPPMRKRYPASFDPETGQNVLSDGYERYPSGFSPKTGQEVPRFLDSGEEVMQTQRPATKTRKWPTGHSISEIFRDSGIPLEWRHRY